MLSVCFVSDLFNARGVRRVAFLFKLGLRSSEVPAVFLRHLAYGGTARVVVLLRAGVQHVMRRCGIGTGAAAVRLSVLIAQIVCAVCVVDGDARLHVVAEHVEADAVTVILDRVRLHLNALSDEIVAVEDRGDAVHDMTAGFLDVVRDHVLEGKHAVNIHVARTGDEIAAVRIFGGQLPADEMAAIEISKYLYMFK